MRLSWKGLFGLTTALLTVCGCWSSTQPLRPPKQPEEFILPPKDDAKFDQPVAYPKGTLNKDLNPDDPNNPMKAPRFGAGSGGAGGPGGQ